MSDARKTAGTSSSSASTLKSLSTSASRTVPAEEKGELIYIPQKCYGIITPNTPKNISGFYTTGLNMCSGIVAIAYGKDNHSIYFCHADTGTDFLDKTHGLPGWINRLPTNLTHITVAYDDVQYKHYKKMMAQLRDLVTSDIVKRQITINASQSNSTDMVVLRDGRIKWEGGIHFEYEEKGYAIDSEPEIKDQLKLLVDHFENDHSPICVFDGDHVLSLSETYTVQPWVKNAVEDANAVESYVEDITELDRTRAELFPESEDQKTTLSQGPR